MVKSMLRVAADAGTVKRSDSAATRLIDGSLAAQRQLAHGTIPAMAESPIPILEPRFRGATRSNPVIATDVELAKAS